MIRRSVAAALWFFAVAWGWNLVALWAELPSFVGLAIGAAVAALVLASPPRVIRPVVSGFPGRPSADPVVTHGVLADRA